MDTWDHLVRLRTDLVDQLETLPEPVWDRPSLCERWRVRDVFAHLVLTSSVPFLSGLLMLVRAGFNLTRMIERDAIERGSAPIPDLVRSYRAAIGSRKLPPGRRPEHLLADFVIHAQDIRRPCGLPGDYPPEALRLVAGTVYRDRVLGPPRLTAGLRLVATDQDWAAGTGDEVSGPLEALVLAMANRSAALPDLSGPGLPALQARMT